MTKIEIKKEEDVTMEVDMNVVVDKEEKDGVASTKGVEEATLLLACKGKDKV